MQRNEPLTLNKRRHYSKFSERADRRAYRSAARILQRAQAAAQAAGELDAFGEYLTRLRERHRRRPTLIAILDNADLR
jgi:uncharacterized Zn finger protein